MVKRRFRMHPEDERRQWQDPEAILARIGLKPGMTFIDLGCGNGFFALPAARMVGSEGWVHGVDTDPELIADLRRRAESEGLKNVRLTVGRAEETIVCRHCADVAFIGNVLHDFDHPARVLINARRAIKAEGMLVDLDWKTKPSPVGPPMAIRFSQIRAREMIAAAGFVPREPVNVGPYHYLIVARPSPGRAG